MSENSDLYEKITIRETVDGQPTTPAPSAESMVEAANDKKKKAAKTTAKKKNSPDPYIWGIYIMLLVISVVEIFSASSSEYNHFIYPTPLSLKIDFLVGNFITIFPTFKCRLIRFYVFWIRLIYLVNVYAFLYGFGWTGKYAASNASTHCGP